MERHASILFNTLIVKGHEIHVFTAASDRRPHNDIYKGNLHFYFIAYDHGLVNCSLVFDIFHRENLVGEFDYVHIESVWLPHWRAKTMPNVAVPCMGFGPSVKILGSLEPTELSEFYNALDVFVNPTLRPHGLDLTLIEPMHCGKPVLVPNFPSIMGTLVLNEGFGYTFSPNVKSFVKALESAIRDGTEVLKRKGLVCKERAVSMFTVATMASAYERFFFLCMKNCRYCQYPRPTDC
ncbi:Phosphatidyl-myo-inositol mannosyltransferase [Camellia lanceoleosa]|uniref:Phosphatidyl-myo-inositol mannosyltransferase n=1 Tax=Camellia lanceoleosa TaxID=1840588 RepID=A0ACC0H6H7_9ERIC|nr:Phosphatidyl-myo-inositol mannosyltransferase [Camellia lanceoleosa]